MPLRSKGEVSIVVGNGNGVEIPGPGSGRGWARFYPGADPATSYSEPTGAIAEVMRRVELGSAQWRGLRGRSILDVTRE